MAIAAVGLILIPSAGSAAPNATTPARGAPHAPLPTDPQVELDELEQRAAKLSKDYRGRLVNLDRAEKAAKQAADRLEEANRELEKARKQVARLAAGRYMDGGLDPALEPLLSDDADSVLDKAVVTEHMARSTRERVEELAALKQSQERTQRAAQERVDEVRDEVEQLEAKRDEVEELMQQFQPESPVTGDSVTPRMRTVRNEIDRRFGPFVTIGCYRGGSFGEHPQGRACDFMLSTGGRMPSPEKVELGWELSNWAKANAQELGVMYIIYRQKIWDARRGGGWQLMGDRGSITQNHFDHPHISVF